MTTRATHDPQHTSTQLLENLAGVFRLFDGDTPVGTAFAVGPRVALTCHHCVADRSASRLTLRCTPSDIRALPVAVSEVAFPPSALCTDIALLRVQSDFVRWLPITVGSPPRYGPLMGFGYPGGSPEQARTRIDLEGRGYQQTFYKHGSAKYQLPRAMMLAGDRAAFGMSGGPVVDLSTDAAVAILVGGGEFDNRSIALPFAEVVSSSSWPAFECALGWSRLNTYQRGWSMNLLGAQQLCSAQVRHALKRWIDDKRFDPATHVKRIDLDSAFVRFMHSDLPILFIASAPNLGKTSAVADLATRHQGRALLLDGFKDVENFRTSLLQYTSNLLQVTDAGSDILHFIGQFKEHSAPLVIFVDAINEVNDDARALQRWLNECAAVARELNLKLVLTGREELSAVSGLRKDLMVFQLAEFSAQEARECASLHGFAYSLETELDRHPLMFRIAAELGAGMDAFGVGRHRAIGDFVKHLIVHARGVTAADVNGLYRVCERIADGMDPISESLEWVAAANLVGGVVQLELLVSAGVLKAREGRVVRFAYDEMAEALRAPMKADATTLVIQWLEGLSDVRLRGRLVGSFLKNVPNSEDSTRDAFVMSLLAAMDEASGLARTLGKPISPLDFSPIIGAVLRGLPRRLENVAQLIGTRFAAAVAAFLEHSPGGHVDEQALAGLDVPWPLKVAVLVNALSSRSDSGLRDKDIFQRGEQYAITRDSERPKTIAGALLALIRTYPTETRKRLICHVGDARRLLGGGEATVGGVVRALLVLSADMEFEQLASLLLDSPGVVEALPLLERISRQHPQSALMFATQHLRDGSAVTMMGAVLTPALQALGPGNAPRTLLDGLLSVMNAAVPATRLCAAQLIRMSDPDDLSAWDALNDLVREGRCTPHLRPLPRARSGQYLDTLVHRHDDWAWEEIASCTEGYMQPQLAAIALALLHEAEVQHYRSLGTLAEERALRLSGGDTQFECWRDFVSAVSRHPAEEVRSQLRYAALGSVRWNLDLLRNVLGSYASDAVASGCFELVFRNGRRQSPGAIEEAFDALLQSNAGATIRAASMEAHISLRLAEAPGRRDADRLLTQFAELVRRRYPLSVPTMRAWNGGMDAVAALAELHVD